MFAFILKWKTISRITRNRHCCRHFIVWTRFNTSKAYWHGALIFARKPVIGHRLVFKQTKQLHCNALKVYISTSVYCVDLFSFNPEAKPEIRKLKMKLLLLTILCLHSAIGYNYLEVLPVKLLDIRSVASRYPASNSEYRTNVENGQVHVFYNIQSQDLDEGHWNISQDEEVDMTEGDTLNNFPSMKLTLNPGGCAFYQIPIQPGEVNSFIQPAKKKGNLYWVLKYCT